MADITGLCAHSDKPNTIHVAVMHVLLLIKSSRLSGRHKHLFSRSSSMYLKCEKVHRCDHTEAGSLLVRAFTLCLPIVVLNMSRAPRYQGYVCHTRFRWNRHHPVRLCVAYPYILTDEHLHRLQHGGRFWPACSGHPRAPVETRYVVYSLIKHICSSPVYSPAIERNHPYSSLGFTSNVGACVITATATVTLRNPPILKYGPLLQSTARRVSNL